MIYADAIELAVFIGIFSLLAFGSLWLVDR